MNSDDIGKKYPIEQGINGNGKRLRGGAWNGGVYKGEVDGMLGLLLMLLV
jgi:hypothetical protein